MENQPAHQKENIMLNWIDIQVQGERRRDLLRDAEQRRLIAAARTGGSRPQRLSDRVQAIAGKWRVVWRGKLRAYRGTPRTA